MQLAIVCYLSFMHDLRGFGPLTYKQGTGQGHHGSSPAYQPLIWVTFRPDLLIPGELMKEITLMIPILLVVEQIVCF